VGEREDGLSVVGVSVVGVSVVGLRVVGRSVVGLRVVGLRVVGANVGLWVGEREGAIVVGLFVLSLPVTAPASKASKNRRIRFASRTTEGEPRHELHELL
jgi:hypothetical protein